MLFRRIRFPLRFGFFGALPTRTVLVPRLREGIQKAVIFFCEIHMPVWIGVLKLIIEGKSGFADHRDILPSNQKFSDKTSRLT